MAVKRSRKSRRRRKILVGVLALCLCLGLALVAVGVVTVIRRIPVGGPAGSADEPAASPSSTQPTDPPGPVPVATATIGSSGDILIHKPVLRAAKQEGNTYDFTSMFSLVSPYVQKVDYAAINVELAISRSGFDTPEMQFRIPPSLITAVAGAGYDLGLLANNHAGDAGSQGYITTREVITENGMDYIGTRGAVADKRYLVKDVNGIKIGMVNYTYGQDTSANSLINRFSDSNLDLFYADMEQQIADMEADGAEAIVLYIHWGYEYFLTPNKYQTAVANKMCEMGVDVIIGGHPHKIQPLELITADNGNQTVCLYSMGNFLSNQVIESMYGGNRSNSANYQDHVSCPIPDVSNRYNDTKWDQHVTDCNDNGHTEDGLLFQTTFTKYSDGVVKLTGIDVLPTWCYRYRDSASDSGFGYKVVPLDKTVEDWGSAFGIPEIDLTYANRSYDRTMALVSEGLTACREAIGREDGWITYGAAEDANGASSETPAATDPAA